MKNRIIIWSFSFLITFLFSLTATMDAQAVKSGYSFSVSPMDEKIVLNPGDKYSGSFLVYSQSDYESDVKYAIEVAPYFVDDSNGNDFLNKYGDNNNIVEWITFSTPTEGRISRGESVKIIYTINVPENAAGGGQYAAILVSGEKWVDEDENETSDDDRDLSTVLKEKKQIAYRIFAEISGDIIRKGEVVEASVPSFLLSGGIKGTSLVKNVGNVHGEAKYKLQVFPLFSNEEIYTNEENPDSHTVLPDRTLYSETSWAGTPGIGIFNVIYTVEFEDVTVQVKKMVIKCPVWLLFVIIFAIVAIVIYFFVRAKARRANRD